MYTVEYLPIAKDDIFKMVEYISVDLKNPEAAGSLAIAIIDSIDSLCLLPYKFPVYTPVKKLKREFRVLRIKNYLVFYYVEEELNVVTVARVLYRKKNITSNIG